MRITLFFASRRITVSSMMHHFTKREVLHIQLFKSRHIFMQGRRVSGHAYVCYFVFVSSVQCLNCYDDVTFAVCLFIFLFLCYENVKPSLFERSPTRIGLYQIDYEPCSNEPVLLMW